MPPAASVTTAAYDQTVGRWVAATQTERAPQHTTTTDLFGTVTQTTTTTTYLRLPTGRFAAPRQLTTSTTALVDGTTQTQQAESVTTFDAAGRPTGLTTTLLALTIQSYDVSVTTLTAPYVTTTAYDQTVGRWVAATQTERAPQHTTTTDLFGTVTQTTTTTTYLRLPTGRFAAPRQLTTSTTALVDGTTQTQQAESVTTFDAAGRPTGLTTTLLALTIQSYDGSVTTLTAPYVTT